MNIFGDDKLCLGWQVSQINPPTFCMTMIVKAVCPLALDRLEAQPVGDVTVTGDAYLDDDAGSLKYSSDFVPHKTKCDVLLVGTAHAPEGKPVEKLRVGLRIGRVVRKTLWVFGDRQWDVGPLSSAPGDPEPFTTLPIRYERAYGGDGFAFNPIGVGYKGAGPPPNVEMRDKRVESPKGEYEPAGFGPLSKLWAPYTSKTGTYDTVWKKERWPWLPDDFDWSYFNAAPADQQIAGYLRGDEEIELVNLHPKHPRLLTRLPAIRPRVFINERCKTKDEKKRKRVGWAGTISDSQLTFGTLGFTTFGDPAKKNEEPQEVEIDWRFREVMLNLDTLLIDADEGQVVLVWRGLANVRTFKIKEVEHIYATVESSADQPLSPDHYEAVLKRLVAENTVEAQAAKIMAEHGKEIQKAEKMAEEQKADAEKKVEEAKAKADAARPDGAPKIEPTTEPQPPITPHAQLKSIRSLLAEHIARAVATPDGEDQVDDLRKKLKHVNEALEKLGPEPPATRDEFLAAAEKSRDFSGLRLMSLDLSGLDLSGFNFHATMFHEVNLAEAVLQEADLSGAVLVSVDLTNADLRSANLDRAVPTDCKLGGAQFRRARLEMTILSRMDFAGVDFTGAVGRGTQFDGSDLSGACFVDSEFAQANFSNCNLENANFERAVLTGAQFTGTRAVGVNMREADACKIHGNMNADFTGASLRKAKADESVWQESTVKGVDFSGASLKRAQFVGADLTEAVFHRAEMTAADFSDATLTETTMTEANLLDAQFDRATITKANFQASNVYNAGFWDAVIKESDFDGANLTNTLLA